MKRILLTVALIALSLTAFAQKTVISELFDGQSRLQWEEYVDKKLGTVQMKSGKMMICNSCTKPSKKINFATSFVRKTTTKLPINASQKFSVKTKFSKPFVGSTAFGVIFNYRDEQNFDAFFVTEGRQGVVWHFENGSYHQIDAAQTILQKGKKYDVDIEMVSMGNKVSFFVNNVDCVTIPMKVKNSFFGLAVTSSKLPIVLIDEVVVEQTIISED